MLFTCSEDLKDCMYLSLLILSTCVTPILENKIRHHETYYLCNLEGEEIVKLNMVVCLF